MKTLNKAKEFIKKGCYESALRALPSYEFVEKEGAWTINKDKASNEEITIHAKIISILRSNRATQGAKKQFASYLRNK